jgi:hypothetical protein
MAEALFFYALGGFNPRIGALLAELNMAPQVFLG